MTASLDELFAGFRRSAWRLESRDTYNIPGDQARIDEFMRTGQVPRKTRENSSWIVTIEDAVARGAYIGRVRLVGHPVTNYTRFELAAYRDNVTAGEDIRIVDRAWLDDSWNVTPDVWVFDDKTAILMRYSDDGAWLGTKEVDAAPLVTARNRITPYAVSLTDYRLTEVPTPRLGSTLPVTLPSEAAMMHG